MATWVSSFEKRQNTATGAKVGAVNLQWVEGADVLFSYSEEYDGTETPQDFKSRVNALRDAELARQAESLTITTQLNNLMNS
jgi:hypothetical protein